MDATALLLCTCDDVFFCAGADWAWVAVNTKNRLAVNRKTFVLILLILIDDEAKESKGAGQF